MSLSRLPSGRWRAQVYDPATRENVSVAKVLGLTGSAASFRTKADAKRAREEARARLRKRVAGVTVAEWRERWLNDPLFARPKESTMRHNAERTRAFAARYGGLPIEAVSDAIVAEWIAGGKNVGTVPALRAMFNDAASAKAGRLVETNPFAGLGLKRTRGLRGVQPPTEEMVWTLIRAARTVSCPSFAAWLQVACFTGLRPGELDGLRPERVDLERNRIAVVEQFNRRSAGSRRRRTAWLAPRS